MPAVLIGILTGLVVGLANGFLVAFVAIPSFLVTLATLGIVIAAWPAAVRPMTHSETAPPTCVACA